jgi:hypothetical protein
LWQLKGFDPVAIGKLSAVALSRWGVRQHKALGLRQIVEHFDPKVPVISQNPELQPPWDA